MTKPKCYIAGPMRGIPQFNFPAFDAARDELNKLGFQAVSPADLDREIGFDEAEFPTDPDYDWQDLDFAGFSLRDAVMRDVGALCDCQCVYFLEGYAESRGASAECQVAMWLGIQQFHASTPRFIMQRYAEAYAQELTAANDRPQPVAEGETVTNADGGKQSFIAARFDLIPPECERLLAECLAFGARKYGAENWRQIPVEDHIAHALNHLNAWRRGNQDEPHLVNTLARVNFALSLLVRAGGHAEDYQHPELEVVSGN